MAVRQPRATSEESIGARSIWSMAAVDSCMNGFLLFSSRNQIHKWLTHEFSRIASADGLRASTDGRKAVIVVLAILLVDDQFQ